MLVIYTANFLIGTVIALYASVASATPAPVTPNTPAILLPRAPQGQGCKGMAWVGRECAGGRGAVSYDDLCSNEHFNIKVPSVCPDKTVCEDAQQFEADLNQVVPCSRCVHVSPPGTAQTRTKVDDPQIGSSAKQRAVTQLANTQFHHEIFIADDFTASVSAVLLGDDDRSIVKPGNLIVGKIRGKEITACKGDPNLLWRYLECIPTGRYPLRFGDAIDFTWGLKSDQIASLKYFVFPS